MATMRRAVLFNFLTAGAVKSDVRGFLSESVAEPPIRELPLSAYDPDSFLGDGPPSECKGAGCQFRKPTPTPQFFGGKQLPFTPIADDKKEFCRGIGCRGLMGHQVDQEATGFMKNCARLYETIAPSAKVYIDSEDRSMQDIKEWTYSWCKARIGAKAAVTDCPAYVDVVSMALVFHSMDQMTDVAGSDEICQNLYLFISASKGAEVDLKLIPGSLGPQVSAFLQKAEGPESDKGKEWRKFAADKGWVQGVDHSNEKDDDVVPLPDESEVAPSFLAIEQNIASHTHVESKANAKTRWISSDEFVAMNGGPDPVWEVGVEEESPRALDKSEIDESKGTPVEESFIAQLPAPAGPAPPGGEPVPTFPPAAPPQPIVAEPVVIDGPVDPYFKAGELPEPEERPPLTVKDHCMSQMAEIMVGTKQSGQQTVEMTKAWCWQQGTMQQWLTSYDKSHPHWSHENCNGMQNLMSFALRYDLKEELDPPAVCERLFDAMMQIHGVSRIVQDAQKTGVAQLPKSFLVVSVDSEKMEKHLREEIDYDASLIQRMQEATMERSAREQEQAEMEAIRKSSEEQRRIPAGPVAPNLPDEAEIDVALVQEKKQSDNGWGKVKNFPDSDDIDVALVQSSDKISKMKFPFNQHLGRHHPLRESELKQDRPRSLLEAIDEKYK